MKKNIQFHFINTLKQTLDEVLQKGYHADRMIDKYVRANKWSREERQLFADSIYYILRHKRLLEFLAGSEDLLKVIAVYFIQKSYKLPPRPEFVGISEGSINNNLQKEKPRAIECSLPDWLDQLGQKEFGERWLSLAKALTDEPRLYIRANTLKTDRRSLQQRLKKEGIATEEKVSLEIEVPQALEVKERKNIFITDSYREGQFEVQDIGSQFIAPLLEVQAGMNVIDACAGSGGKTLHIAALMQNKGSVLAMDIMGYKLKDLQARADKAGCQILKTQLIDSPKVIQKLKNTADRVLLDVPCSGLGVLKRNPDSKWKMNLEQVDELVQTQRKILVDYTEMCKPNGLVVYSTCSLLHRENEEQIQWFLNKTSKWKLLNQYRVWPDTNVSDGFYAAVLKKL
ncbi:RsmB/NOP family class I SAM-dependent RNA methyltransferase [Pseudobdellovibrio exovorus]|uniref:SAM-dependent MTase RsmB/NOP-type domain-containing protein n=1 Tax=Pseudobdellovibrio exovorus JSS TaxID=1184267 RepID=M4VQG9_9BACT|nr:class I SAM-dependent methyltransferase [Pseudobdellovibrio exovorus]AGH95404.1 hypothetical protein A11Q_1188 [Pseudobdellovibrio exovorus JSS]